MEELVTFLGFPFGGRGRCQKYLWGDAVSWKEVRRKTDRGAQTRWISNEVRLKWVHVADAKLEFGSGFTMRIWNIFSKTVITEAACVDKIIEENNEDNYEEGRGRALTHKGSWTGLGSPQWSSGEQCPYSRGFGWRKSRDGRERTEKVAAWSHCVDSTLCGGRFFKRRNIFPKDIRIQWII